MARQAQLLWQLTGGRDGSDDAGGGSGHGGGFAMAGRYEVT